MLKYFFFLGLAPSVIAKNSEGFLKKETIGPLLLCCLIPISLCAGTFSSRLLSNSNYMTYYKMLWPWKECSYVTAFMTKRKQDYNKVIVAEVTSHLMVNFL